jgi:4-diphosphocytidyl-2-C-methyl-D-erythritol kinase
MEALRAHDLEKLALTVQNDLEAAALRLRPGLASVLTAGVDATALGALLSGSGPTCLFLCRDQPHAQAVVAALRERGIGPVSFARGPVPGARVERLG